MATEAPEFTSCRLCERTILRGERVYRYLTPEGEEVGVCALCRERAEAVNWLPAELATRAVPAAGRRRRRGTPLRERLARASEAAGARLAGRREQEGDTEPETAPVPPAAPPRPASPEPKPAPAPPPSPERRLRDAVEAFNTSHEARKVAGLCRSLGQPRASVRLAGGDGALVTVAWELSWYEWRVHGDGVSEVRKGGELGDLDDAASEWNAAVGEDGRLRVEGGEG